jgi:hypothetical protein
MQPFTVGYENGTTRNGERDSRWRFKMPSWNPDIQRPWTRMTMGAGLGARGSGKGLDSYKYAFARVTA